MRNANISGLTSIRFFAAFWVVLYHLAADWDSLRRFGSFLLAGYSGVTLFFVLSGFILSYNYLPRDFEVRDFWSARAARILPVYLFALILSAPFAVHWCHKQGMSFLPIALSAPIMVQAWIPKAALCWNGPGWSLSCEAFFYLLFPILALPISRLFRRKFAIVFAAVWILGAVPSLWYALARPEGIVDLSSRATLLTVIKFNPLLRLPEFLLGIGLGALYLDGRRISRPRIAAVACVIGLVVLLTILTRMPYPALHNGLLAPIYGVLILSLASDPTILGNSTLVLLGESSYSLYLLHSPIYQWCYWLAKRFGWSGYYLVNVGYLIIVVLVSVASYKLIEAPGRVFIRSRLLARNRKSPAYTASAS